ncbi:TonB-dependent receptor [Aureibaculum marinum]|uniref:TonB-dependent receptor n=1 Tax=Aureibaculum marinum TaxID=2487930 RepID=A0A3N4P6D8_9FLAO|nr:TonB-dependent receptor [Aureibaculum marinum]RPE00201.1 TonB-dependent receptor [Aureibaculum marinum]
MIKYFALAFSLMFFALTNAQTVVSGKVSDSNGEPVPGANIIVVGTAAGTATDFDGLFTLKVNQTPPFSIQASFLGLESVTAEVTSNNQTIDFVLKESNELDEVVISASRTPERILESPVTVERMDARDIKNTSSESFYNGLENLKGVDVSTSSLTFKSVNTRGFATFANTRFMQLVDGMDNSSPALNFALGNLLGMSELDVNTVELLPGASSALYGANAFNGILFMTSKNPFDDDGISTYFKTGVTMQDAAGDNPYYDLGIRAAYKFSDKFAAKATLSYLQGTEWYATDYNQYVDAGAGNPDVIIPTVGNATSFDQANIYGDEVAVPLDFEALALGAGFPQSVAEALGTQTISRTGYKESDLTDYKAESVKAAFAFHYRPFADDLEVIYNAKFGIGNTIYQGANRYNINNFLMQQHKLEIRNDNFFLRGYITDENAGDSYDMRFAGINMNKANATQWFGAYAQTFLGAIAQGSGQDAAHAAARQFADANVTLQPGTPEFDAQLEAITSDPDLNTGAKFQDQTKLYHVDGNYNFHNLIDFAEIQIGGSYREYALNSSGTIFTDYDGAIHYDEYGAYMQVQKKLVDERLKLTGSIRYDKAQNFDGNVSPRISVSYSLGEGKTRNLRFSYQTGFRNPTTQDQYIGLDAGQAILVGSAPDNLDRYTSKPLDNSLQSQALGFPATVQLTGRDAYENSFTLASVMAFGASAAQGAPNPGLLEVADFDYVKPERVQAFEIGYRAGFGRLMLDASAYYNIYEDFIGNKTVVSPHYGSVNLASDITNLPPELGGPIPTAIIAIGNGDYQPFQLYTNSEADISSYGATIGVSTKVFNSFDFGINYTYAKFDFDQSSDPDYEAGFNTPEHKVKVGFGNTSLFKNFGFQIDYRWSDEFLWESSFADAMIDARSVVDAQVNYSIPKMKSIFKLGGTNIGGKEFMSAPGTGSLGSMYYVSWIINL